MTPAAPPAGATSGPAALGGAARLRLALFGLLERASDLRGNAAAGQLRFTPPPRPERALWVYASTIGELNAVGVLLRELLRRLPGLRLVLITNHAHYETSYRAQYPDAQVCSTLGHRDDAAELARHHPPAMLLVAEIPCLPSDAPCRFSVAFAAEAKRRGAAAVIVNGWLYGDPPSCRMDSIERRLLQRDYVRAFDAICMQLPEGRQAMLDAGAPADHVHVVGNLKFDAMSRGGWDVNQARSARLLAALLHTQRPVIVAGCVTNLDEQRLVLEAYRGLLAEDPTALLVLAPRHPEKRDRIEALAQVLAEQGLSASFRSQLGDEAPLPQTACLILDTMGDLRDFYAAAGAAHVGVDHNVLEPLAFGKPVSVVGGWNPKYPSFPVYRLLHEHNAFAQVADAADLLAFWRAAFGAKDRAAAGSAGATEALSAVRGALERHLAALEPWIRHAAQAPRAA